MYIDFSQFYSLYKLHLGDFFNAILENKQNIFVEKKRTFFFQIPLTKKINYFTL